MALGSPRRLSLPALLKACVMRDACLRHAASTTQTTLTTCLRASLPTAMLYTHRSLMPAGPCFKHGLLALVMEELPA